MFHVLTEPFPRAIAEHLKDSKPTVVLVYSGERAERVLASFRPFYWNRQALIHWFETVADELNNPPDFLFLKTMLGSIRETEKQWELDRRASARKMSQANFGADFGRLDFTPPGRGGSGIDGYW